MVPMLMGWGAPPAVEAPALAVRLEADVRRLCREPRSAGTPGLEAAFAFVEASLRATGGRVASQPYEAGGLKVRNVIARFGPARGPRVVVGAHVDAWGPHPGADDNASGVAGLLELARRLGAAPPSGPVELVAYTLEEPPFFRSPDMGSVRHAEALKEAGVAVKAMLCLDMIGVFSEAPGSQAWPPEVPKGRDRADFIALTARPEDRPLVEAVARAMRGASPLPVETVLASRRVKGVDWSDHHPYWDRGWTALMVSDTAFLRFADYHTERDTPDRLDYRRMGQVVVGVEAAVRALAAGRP